MEREILKKLLKSERFVGGTPTTRQLPGGGVLGFLSGKKQIEALFGRKFSDRFNIHRTRQNFPRDGIDTFPNMAQTGLGIIDRVVPELMQGHQDAGGNNWHIPLGEFPGMPKRKTD